VSNVGGQVSRDQTVAIRGVSDGVKPCFFPREFPAQLNHATTQLLESQDRLTRWSPWEKLHAPEELEDAERIDRIGLGPGQPGALKVFNGSWVDRQPRRRSSRVDRYSEAIPRRFE
jgi:hypothetical protein